MSSVMLTRANTTGGARRNPRILFDTKQTKRAGYDETAYTFTYAPLIKRRFTQDLFPSD
jgi:hypothetical protein